VDSEDDGAASQNDEAAEMNQPEARLGRWDFKGSANQHDAWFARVPNGVRSPYEGWRWTLAWNHPGGGVFRLEAPSGETRFLKLTAGPRAPRLQPEAHRLRWAGAYLPVPEVLDTGSENGVDWLLTTGLPGRDGTSPELLAEPAKLVATLARGLRHFHEAAPVSGCPFDFRLDVALAQVQQRAATSLIDPEEDFHPDHGDLSLGEAVARLEAMRPSEEDLVVCHGDYCFPNALIENGEVTGYLDLGELGVADRWWDLAVASWSTTWNVGPGYEDLFLTAYRIEPDRERIAYYRLLYDLVS
jgi:kanamycin kinase